MNEISDTFIRLPEVMKRTGLSRSSIYAMAKAKTFPSQIRLSTRTSVWSSRELSDWIEEKKQERGEV